MDQETRNQLQRATQDARRLLEAEFAEQLEGTYDILPDGTIHDKPGAHLDDRERLTRLKLVDAIQHRVAGGKTNIEAVADYTREAAFTFLNRFVALKMLEARDLVQQCVSKGEQSSGFKEFSGLAPGLAELPDKGYRLYLECLFDELSIEVKVLFDRQDAASLIWPRRQAMLVLLEILNQARLSSAWNQDETIGWVYQYFNGDDERSHMRAQSAAPRNSRELAVRNQFFTPRYVVQFLTDNTLGRTWYEMMRGDTQLAHLDYLVRRPNEIFLADGELASRLEIEDSELSQEELLQQAVYIPFREKKDPRDLKVLDPACGSGHFLLYAFDLFVTIYEEAWKDAKAPPFTESGTQLRAEYASIQSLRCALPELIVRHNLHGVDIDPRAAQIAALALWMRAQRALQEFATSIAERPHLTKTQIVVAEPMPGDSGLVDEFANSLQPNVLGDLFKTMVQEMKLAGELGSLLKIEESLAQAIKKAEAAHRQSGLFAERIEGADFWGTVDEKIIAALRDFAESVASATGMRRQLFVSDAVEGVAFIELMRKQFDVVLMNPPFGAFTANTRAYAEREYAIGKHDILAAFVSRARALASAGRTGAITNRTVFFIKTLASWRTTHVICNDGLEHFVDLGHGVLDAALVEAAAYTLGGGLPPVATSALEHRDKAAFLAQASSTFGNESHWCPVATDILAQTKTQGLAYWAPPQLLASLLRLPTLDEAGVHTRVGLQTSDDFRFLRLQWEVPGKDVGRHGWVPFAKGGEYSPYSATIHLCVLWHDNAREQKAFCYMHTKKTGISRGNDATGTSDYYFRPGLTYSERTTSDISVRVLPSDMIMGTSGPGILVDEGIAALSVLAYMNTRVFREFLELSIGSGDAVHSGSAARHYTAGSVAAAPALPRFSAELAELGSRLVNATRVLLASDPTAPGQVLWEIMELLPSGIEAIAHRRSSQIAVAIKQILRDSLEVENEVMASLSLSAESRQFVSNQIGLHPEERPNTVPVEHDLSELWRLSVDDLVDHVAKVRGASRQITKKSWIANRRIELLSALTGARGSILVDRIAKEVPCAFCTEAEVAGLVMEGLVGNAFGDGKARPESANNDDPFEACWGIASRQQIQGKAVMPDDSGHADDASACVEKALVQRVDDPGAVIEELVSALGARSVRSYLRERFFVGHVKRYSQSRRKAPIYWQLGTGAANYCVWVYYHRLTQDTFYNVLNEYVRPKLEHEQRKLDRIRSEIGPDPSRSQRAEIDHHETFIGELRSFAEEIERVAPLWNPDLNDGVIINFAPLWRLTSHNKAWQKECKARWDELVKGKYDWASLAMHLWPERVVRKCHKDVSLAVAHGLDRVFWQQDERDEWVANEEPEEGWDSVIKRLVAERAKPSVKAALENLINAPAPTNGKKRRKSGKRRTKAK